MARAPLAWMSFFGQCHCPTELCQPAWSLPEEVQCNTCTAIRIMVIQEQYSLSWSHRNHCQNFSGFLFEKNQVFRGYQRGCTSGNVATTWLVASGWRCHLYGRQMEVSPPQQWQYPAGWLCHER